MNDASAEITELLAGYPSHRQTFPKHSDRPDAHKSFSEASELCRQVAFRQPYTFRTVVVTGSNGKGSTASILCELLRLKGLRVGAISSPAMNEDCTDMISIDGEPISPSRLHLYLTDVATRVDASNHPSFTHYMALCISAYRYFRELDIDVAVVETAIGGRYDPTRPYDVDLCLFTNITLEHADVLGPSHCQIAHHKSEIIGERSRVIVSEQVDPRSVEILTRRAQRNNGSLMQVMPGSNRGSLIADLPTVRIADGQYCPAYQHANLRLAAHAADCLTPGSDLLPISFERPMPRMFPQNRFEVRYRNGTTYVFDSAHNEDGYLELARSLVARFGFMPSSYITGPTRSTIFDHFLKAFQPSKVTVVAGYHPRVKGRPTLPSIDAVDFTQLERASPDGILVVVGIFLCPVIKARLFPESAVLDQVGER